MERFCVVVGGVDVVVCSCVVGSDVASGSDAIFSVVCSVVCVSDVCDGERFNCSEEDGQVGCVRDGEGIVEEHDI